MFNSCNTLLELNQARMVAIKAGGDVPTINAAYNIRKKEIMQRRVDYKRIEVHRAPTIEVSMHIPLPIVGTPDEKNMIEITPNGIRC